MCALICALHRERRGFLPQGRKDLYDAALSMLLERRDRERDMYTPGRIQLTRDPQIQLLQKLAYWMIRNGRSEMSQHDATALLTDALAAMPHVADQGTTEQIFRHLLIRSGLLREPAVGAVDFVHRTFQDYLGAKAAVEDRDFGLLVHNAHLDQWEDVIRMAVAHARKGERAEILTGLLERDEQRCVLLAAASLEDATELDPHIRARIETLTAALLPPQDDQVLEDLVKAGPIVLSLLPGPAELTTEEARRVVMTAQYIGTDSSIPVLRRFCHHPAVEVRQQLASYWHGFETDVYAEEIIAQLTQDDIYFAVRNPAELAALHGLGGRSRIKLSAPLDPHDLRKMLIADCVTHIWVEGYTSVSDLGWLGTLPSLRSVLLTDDQPIVPEDLRPLVPAHVEVAYAS